MPNRGTYIALLRGVNVGGNALPMDRLRGLCRELGLANARTYVQSGNLVFQAEGTAAHWSDMLERALVGKTRLPVSVLVRTGAEIAKLVERNPFLREKGIDPARLYVTFLKQTPMKAALAALRAIEAGPDRFEPADRQIYLHCPDGYGRSKLANTVLERVLKTDATTRNWRSVTTLAKMAADPAAKALLYSPP
jgi:uncharacterized protein (DUF1697 family)